MQVLREFIGLPVEMDEAAAIGADPDISFFVFHKTVHIIVLQAMGIGGAVLVMRKLPNVLIKIADALFVGADPDDPIIVFV